MQLFRKMRLSPPGERATSWRMRSGGREVSCSASMSRQKWLIIVKRNIARLVPATKNADSAPRVVIKPAVALVGVPYTVDCVLWVRAVMYGTLFVSAAE